MGRTPFCVTPHDVVRAITAKPLTADLSPETRDAILLLGGRNGYSNEPSLLWQLRPRRRRMDGRPMTSRCARSRVGIPHVSRSPERVFSTTRTAAWGCV